MTACPVPLHRPKPRLPESLSWSWGADVAQQMLKERLVDEIHIQLVPVLLGSGIRLFENFGETPVELTCERAVNSPQITHLKYKVVK